jgi:hypothetical protein
MANQEVDDLIRINNTSLPHVCDVCTKDLHLCTEYYCCRDCPDTFYWCNSCFYSASRKIRSPGEIHHPDEYTGQVVTSTRSSHIHRFTQFIVYSLHAFEKVIQVAHQHTGKCMASHAVRSDEFRRTAMKRDSCRK